MRIYFNSKRINRLNIEIQVNDQRKYEFCLKFSMNAAFVDIDIKEGDDLKITLKPQPRAYPHLA